MSARSPVSIVEHFADLTDPPRREGTYPLMTFLVVGVCAVHCGADDFVALGCQVKIAQAIVDGGGNYVLAVKGNQKSLYNSIDRFWNDHSKDDFARVKVDRHHTQERGHGREERREYVIRAVPESFPDRQRWPQWKAIGIAVNHTLRDGKWTRDVRCYILSVLLDGAPVWRGGTRSLGHRKPLPLATRCDVSRGPVPPPQRTLRRQLRRAPPHGHQPAQEPSRKQSRHQEQTPHRRPQRAIPDGSPAG